MIVILLYCRERKIILHLSIDVGSVALRDTRPPALVLKTICYIVDIFTCANWSRYSPCSDDTICLKSSLGYQCYGIGSIIMIHVLNFHLLLIIVPDVEICESKIDANGVWRSEVPDSLTH